MKQQVLLYFLCCTCSVHSFATCFTIGYRQEIRVHGMSQGIGCQYTVFILPKCNVPEEEVHSWNEGDWETATAKLGWRFCVAAERPPWQPDRGWDITHVSWTRGRVWQDESWKKLKTDRFIMNLIEMLTSLFTILLKRGLAVRATRNNSHVVLAY